MHKSEMFGTKQDTETKRGIQHTYGSFLFRQNKNPPSGHPFVQRVRFAGTLLLAACGPRWTGQVLMMPRFRRIKDLLLESLLFLF